MKKIQIKGVAKYFIALRKNGLCRSEAISRIADKYKTKGRMFFASEVS